MVADVGSLARLPLILSDGHLRELALTGKDFDAARAEKIGLVNDVYDDAESSLKAAPDRRRDRRQPTAHRQRHQGRPGSATHRRVSESLRYGGVECGVPAVEGSDRGISATFAKRAPNFTGE